MSENTKEPRGLSAAQARRPVKRAKTPKDRSEPRQFTIRRGEEIMLDAGTMKDVFALLPRLPATLLRRRLDSGERDYDRLSRPPDSPATRKRRMAPVPMYRRK